MLSELGAQLTKSSLILLLSALATAAQIDPFPNGSSVEFGSSGVSFRKSSRSPLELKVPGKLTFFQTANPDLHDYVAYSRSSNTWLKSKKASGAAFILHAENESSFRVFGLGEQVYWIDQNGDFEVIESIGQDDLLKANSWHAGWRAIMVPPLHFQRVLYNGVAISILSIASRDPDEARLEAIRSRLPYISPLPNAKSEAKFFKRRGVLFLPPNNSVSSIESIKKIDFINPDPIRTDNPSGLDLVLKNLGPSLEEAPVDGGPAIAFDRPDGLRVLSIIFQYKDLPLSVKRFAVGRVNHDDFYPEAHAHLALLRQRLDQLLKDKIVARASELGREMRVQLESAPMEGRMLRIDPLDLFNAQARLASLVLSDYQINFDLAEALIAASLADAYQEFRYVGSDTPITFNLMKSSWCAPLSTGVKAKRH